MSNNATETINRFRKVLGIGLAAGMFLIAAGCETMKTEQSTPGSVASGKNGNAIEQKGWQMGKPIVSYWAGAMPMTDFAAKQLADGGWNMAWVTSRGKPKDVSLADYYLQQLNILHKHGLRGILHPAISVSRNPADPQAFDDPKRKAKFEAMVEAVKDHPAMYAYTLRDEPNAGMFPVLARIIKYLKENDPKHFVYVNLYPMTISGKRLKVEGEPGLEAGGEYLRQFVEICKPELLCYDHYHFSVRGDGIDYFLNLKLIREAALKADIPFMNIVQACSWTVNMRIPTSEEMRWLYYTSLAYGSQGISQYVYSHPGHDGGMAYVDYCGDSTGNSGVVKVGEPTPLYYYVSKLNREFVAIAKELQPLKSVAVHHLGILPKGATYLPKNAPFKLDPAVPEEAFPGKSVEKLSKKALALRFAQGGATGNRLKGFVIGTFGKDKKATHALVVNLDYRTWGGIAHKRRNEFVKPVQREIVGPGPLEVFDAETGRWTPAGSNRVKLSLPPGDGVLVRLTP